MEGSGWCQRRRVQPVVTSQILLYLLLLLAGEIRCAPSALPSESDSTPSSESNAVGMFLIAPRALTIQRTIFITDDSDDDVINYYIPVIMSEMAAPVSTRDPNIIFVRGCRGGYETDPSGACRKIFSFPSYPKPSTGSRLPFVPRIPPRPRVVPQTQRDLVRQFNPSISSTRRRVSWFGRSLGGGYPPASSSSSSSSSSPSSSSGGPSLSPTGLPLLPLDDTTSTTTTTVRTTTPDNDD